LAPLRKGSNFGGIRAGKKVSENPLKSNCKNSTTHPNFKLLLGVSEISNFLTERPLPENITYVLPFDILETVKDSDSQPEQLVLPSTMRRSPTIQATSIRD
jgi:hypothetical protein